jgi:hypothetical protein
VLPHYLCCNVANMTREEYEQRKRRLEEQLRTGVELLEAAYREQMRALDLVWMARSEEGVPLPPPALKTASSVAREEAPPRPAPAVPRRPRGDLNEEVTAALDSLPEVFDRNQVCEVLGYQPDRSTLFRVLQQLAFQGVLAFESYGGGRRTTKYRKTGGGDSSGDG